MPQLGVVFEPDCEPGALQDAARQAEALGFDEMWVVEDCFLHGGLTAATAALAATTRLRVGVGLLPSMVRNPAIVAMELATIASLFPDRLEAAFGHGVEAWMQQIDARPADRIVALEEVVGCVAALLRGDRVTTHGRFVHIDGVQLRHPPTVPPPLLIGTTGPRGLNVTRRLAEGLVLPEGTSVEAIRAARAALTEQAAITVYAWLRIDEDSERARDVALPVVRQWRADALYPSLIAHAQLPDADALTSIDTNRVAVLGTAAECVAQVGALAAAGATSVVVRPIGDDPGGQLVRLAAGVGQELLDR